VHLLTMPSGENRRGATKRLKRGWHRLLQIRDEALKLLENDAQNRRKSVRRSRRRSALAAGEGIDGRYE